jgi:hypothetical protein
MRKLLLMATALIALAAGSPASADIVIGGQLWTTSGATTLSLTPTVPGGNQPLNSPCIICGANQPQQVAGFGYTNFNNTGQPNQTIAYFSTAVVGGGNPGADTIGIGYDCSFLRNYLLSQNDPAFNFSIGFDVNDTGTAQTLESFWFLNLTQHTVLAAFSPEPGGVLVPSQNNGTGFPDYTLSGLSLNRGDIAPGDQLIFFARITGANDGPDSFFLVANPTVAAVPELSTWMMMIVGFAGVGTLALRKRRQIGEHAFRVV